MPYIIFFTLMCGILIWVTIGRKDLFPFSWYPMYSAAYGIDQVRVLRIALKDKDGGIIWWRTKYYRYPEFVAKKLSKLMSAAAASPLESSMILLEQKRLLGNVLRLIEQEDGSLKNFTALLLVERSTNAALKVNDVVLATILFSDIRHGVVR